jgi:3D (Asp-Asp-Asp) domain-containing protein/peptidoglycan hydrolase CwlO-like protein
MCRTIRKSFNGAPRSLIEHAIIAIIATAKDLMRLLPHDFRKNTGSMAPPKIGGFRVIRALVFFFAFLMAASMLTAVGITVPANRAAAQQAPKASSGSDNSVNDVVTLDSEINSLKTKISELSGRSSTLEQRIGSISSKLDERRARLTTKRKALAARARSLYVNGRMSKLAMLVSSRGVTDYMNRSDMMQKIAERDAQMISDTRREAETLNASLSQLKHDKSEIDKVTAEARSRQQRLEKSRSERAAVVAAAGANSQQVVAQSGQVEQKMKEINPAAPTVTGRPTGKVMTMVATAYSPEEPGLDDHTASGMRATRGVVAVDPRVIPLGTRLNVEGYGNCIAGDTGSAIKGNRIDLCFDTLEEMEAYGGYHTVRVEILD